MNVVSGTRRAIKELVDGTIRVQVDIDPRFRKAFFDLFPNIDAPVALAPLADDFERQSAPDHAEPAHRSLGPLALLAVRWCRDPDFQAWAGDKFGLGRVATQEECREVILDLCQIGSRREIDTVPTAAERFQREFRGPFMEYLEMVK